MGLNIWFYCVEPSIEEYFLYTNKCLFVVFRFCTNYDALISYLRENNVKKKHTRFFDIGDISAQTVT